MNAIANVNTHTVYKYLLLPITLAAIAVSILTWGHGIFLEKGYGGYDGRKLIVHLTYFFGMAGVMTGMFSLFFQIRKSDGPTYYLAMAGMMILPAMIYLMVAAVAERYGTFTTTLDAISNVLK